MEILAVFLAGFEQDEVAERPETQSLRWVLWGFPATDGECGSSVSEGELPPRALEQG